MPVHAHALEAPAWHLPASPVRSAHALQQAYRQGREKLSVIDNRGLDRILHTDLRRGQIEVQSQTAWSALARELARPAPALAALAGRNLLAGTVGSDVVCNAPGPDGHPVVSLVRSLTLVTAEGELRRASRACNAELFALAVGGHEAFGTLYSVTLSIEALVRASGAASPAERLELAGPAPRRGGARRLTLYLPPESAQGFLDEARARARDWHVCIANVEVRRTEAEHETVLRWARRAYACVTLGFENAGLLGGAVLRTQFFRGLLDEALRLGGSFAIASTPEASRAQALACYPMLPRVLAEKLRHDPRDRLQPAWYRHHRRLLQGEAPRCGRAAGIPAQDSLA